MNEGLKSHVVLLSHISHTISIFVDNRRRLELKLLKMKKIRWLHHSHLLYC